MRHDKPGTGDTDEAETQRTRAEMYPDGRRARSRWWERRLAVYKVCPSGKSVKFCPAHLRKIFRLTRRANQRYQLAPSFPGKRGGRASSRTWSKDAVDAAASARNGVAGRVSRERSTGAQDERRFQRTAKPYARAARSPTRAAGQQRHTRRSCGTWVTTAPPAWSATILEWSAECCPGRDSSIVCAPSEIAGGPWVAAAVSLIDAGV